MKKVLFATLLLASTAAWAKPKPEEYTINVHVQSSDVICGYAIGCIQHLNVVIDGKKFELNSAPHVIIMDLSARALIIGDYKAKLVIDDPDPDHPLPTYEYHQKYEFLLPDGKTKKYIVVGASE